MARVTLRTRFLPPIEFDTEGAAEPSLTGRLLKPQVTVDAGPFAFTTAPYGAPGDWRLPALGLVILLAMGAMGAFKAVRAL